MTKIISIPFTSVQIFVILAVMFDVGLFFLMSNKKGFLFTDVLAHLAGFIATFSFKNKSYHYFSYGLTLIPKIPIRFKLKSEQK